MKKTSRYTMQVEEKLTLLVNGARKRRAYIHALAMAQFTPGQYKCAIPMLTLQGYGVNVFPVHHVHPPLSMAIIGGHPGAVQSLLGYGADPHMTYPTNGGRTSPFQVLCEFLVRYAKEPKLAAKYRTMLLSFQAHKSNLDAKVHPLKPETFRSILSAAGYDALLF